MSAQRVEQLSSNLRVCGLIPRPGRLHVEVSFDTCTCSNKKFHTCLVCLFVSQSRVSAGPEEKEQVWFTDNTETLF